MKNKIFFLGLVSMAYLSCTKEQIPSGLNLYDPINTVNISDTTYIITSIPVAQSKNVLIEEATGVRCPNCPAGADIVHNLQMANPNRIFAAGIYSEFQNELVPPYKYDFRSKDADDLDAFLGGAPYKPSAAIDRVETGTSNPYFWGKENWAAAVNTELTKSTRLNLELEVIPNDTNYYLKSKVTFTDTITADLALSVYIIEDSVIDKQEFPASVIDTNYVHNHIMRDIITPLSGSSFLGSITTKEKGRVFERTFEIALPSNVLNKNHVKLLCFVHKTGSSKEVLQVEEIDL